MAFRVRAFNQLGNQVGVQDPFLASLNEQEPFSPEAAHPKIPGLLAQGSGSPTQTGPNTNASRFPAGPKTGTRVPKGVGKEAIYPALLDPFDQDPFERIYNAAREDVLEPAFEDRALRGQIDLGVETLEQQIERLSQPLQTSPGGTPAALRSYYDALKDGGFEGASAYFEGAQQRLSEIAELTGQRSELLETLDALDVDGSSPNQILRDFLRHTPNVNGRDFPAPDPMGETPEDVIELFNQAVLARAATGGERYDSGYPGALGGNIDGYYTLINSGKLTMDEEGLEVRFDRFDGIQDYVDYFSLEFRFFPPGETDEPSEAQILAAMYEQDPTLADKPERELRLMTAAVADRIASEQNLGSAGEALEDWLIIQSYFEG